MYMYFLFLISCFACLAKLKLKVAAWNGWDLCQTDICRCLQLDWGWHDPSLSWLDCHNSFPKATLCCWVGRLSGADKSVPILGIVPRLVPFHWMVLGTAGMKGPNFSWPWLCAVLQLLRGWYMMNIIFRILDYELRVGQ